MRCIALVNQKGGVGKTTTAVNLGAALAEQGKRVVLVDLDPQANLTVHLGLEVGSGEPSVYDVLVGGQPLASTVHPTASPGLFVVPSNLDLSGAELELAHQFGRETLLREAVETWRADHRESNGEDPADYVLIDCPPSLGLLCVNGLAACEEVFIAVQTEFFALRGLSKLMEIVELVKNRIHPGLEIGGILPCLYDSRLKLAREVLGEIKKFFPGKVFRRSIGVNVKLAEAPSYGQTILEYAPESSGARDYRLLAEEILTRNGATPSSEDEEVVLVPKARANASGPGTSAPSDGSLQGSGIDQAAGSGD